MRAVTLLEPGELASTTIAEEPEPGPSEALVAVRRVGICGTDLHAFHGRQSLVNGIEEQKRLIIVVVVSPIRVVAIGSTVPGAP